jgi:ubiquitin carboxyl-terminal hydrolase 4/11/15
MGRPPQRPRGGGAAVVYPAALKQQIGRLNSQFSGFDQQDSQELLRFLLDGLHEDTNRVRQKPAWSAGARMIRHSYYY